MINLGFWKGKTRNKQKNAFPFHCAKKSSIKTCKKRRTKEIRHYSYFLHPPLLSLLTSLVLRYPAGFWHDPVKNFGVTDVEQMVACCRDLTCEAICVLSIRGNVS